MINQEQFLDQKIESQEAVNILRRNIEEFILRKNVESRTLFSLSPTGGRLGVSIADRDELQDAGIRVMESFGLDQNYYLIDQLRGDLNEDGARVVANGAKQYLVFPSLSNQTIEFVREATYIKLPDKPTEDILEMAVNNVKWSIRFNVDPNYIDNRHP